MLTINWLDKKYSIESYSDYQDGLLLVKKGCYYGVIDLEQNIIIPHIYTEFRQFKNGVARVRKDGVYYYIDKQNNIVVSGDKYYIEEYGDDVSTNGLITVGSIGDEPRKWGVVNLKGELVVPLVYDKISLFQYGLATVKKDGGCGYINENGELVIPLIYDNCWDFKNGVATVLKNKKYGVIDTTGKEIVACEYDGVDCFADGTVVAEKNEKWGLFSKTGEAITPFIYDNVYTYGNGYARVTIDGKSGLIDGKGVLVVPIEYEDVSYFHNGFAEASISKRKKVYVRHDGKIIGPYSSMLFGFNEGLAPIKKKGKWGFIDEDGVEVIPPQYLDATGFLDGIARVVDSNLKCGYIDKYNKVVIPFIYDWILTFEGKNFTVVKNGDSPFFKIAQPIKDGVIDRAGVEILPLDYDMVISTDNNILLVLQDNRWGVARVE